MASYGINGISSKNLRKRQHFVTPKHARDEGHVLTEITGTFVPVISVAWAGPRGIEPRPLVLETSILPLNYRPSAVHSTRKMLWGQLTTKMPEP